MMFSRAAGTALRRRALLSATTRSAVRVHAGCVTAASTRVFSELSTTAVPNPEMFCRQCEQTKDNYACKRTSAFLFIHSIMSLLTITLCKGTSLGVCGKTPETAAIQDALMEVIKSLAVWCVEARKVGATPAELLEANEYTLKATFSTLTNVNFSEDRIAEYIHQGMDLKKQMMNLVNLKGGSPPESNVSTLELAPTMSPEELEEFGRSVSIPVREARMGDQDCFSLNEIATCTFKYCILLYIVVYLRAL
jgi:hydroxylamine reductase